MNEEKLVKNSSDEINDIYRIFFEAYEFLIDHFPTTQDSDVDEYWTKIAKELETIKFEKSKHLAALKTKLIVADIDFLDLIAKGQADQKELEKKDILRIFELTYKSFLKHYCNNTNPKQIKKENTLISVLSNYSISFLTEFKGI